MYSINELEIKFLEEYKMNKNNWIKGAMILGLSFFIAIFLVKPIGVSTQFSVLSGIIHSTIDSDVIVEDSNRESGYASSNAYYDKSEGKLAKAIKNPINYDFIFVLSIPIGGLLGYMLFKNKRKNGEEDASRDAVFATAIPTAIIVKKILYKFCTKIF